MDEKLRIVIEKEGWNIVDEGTQYLISKYSPEGEDFGFTIEKGTIEEMCESISEYALNFDVDEHAKLWITNQHVQGVPQSIRTLIDDALSISDMLTELEEVVREV